MGARSSIGLSYKVAEATPGHLGMDNHKDQTMRMGPRCCWGSSSRVVTLEERAVDEVGEWRAV